MGCRSDHRDTTQQSYQQLDQGTSTNHKHHKKNRHKNREYSQNQSSSSQSSPSVASGSVPAKVYDVLTYIRQNGRAPDGYVGGRTFGNFENHLPKTDASGNRIKYQEWDVNPKVQGQNRGTERLITGSDGRAYFTADHYNTFTEIKWHPTF